MDEYNGPEETSVLVEKKKENAGGIGPGIQKLMTLVDQMKAAKRQKTSEMLFSLPGNSSKGSNSYNPASLFSLGNMYGSNKEDAPDLSYLDYDYLGSKRTNRKHLYGGEQNQQD